MFPTAVTLLFAVIDWFIHARLKAQASGDELRRLRLVAGVSLALSLESAGIGLSLTSEFGWTSRLCCGVVALAAASVPLRMRLLGTTRGSGTVLWGSLLLASLFAGLHADALASFISPQMGLVVMLAMYVDGMRRAMVAAVLTLAGAWGLYAAHRTGHVLPAFVPDTDPLPSLVANACVGVLGLTFFAWLNYASRQRAYADLAAALERVKESEAARDRAEGELRLKQKLEAVGRLAAGVAHEINTPVQFVGHSMEFISDAFAGFSRAFEAYAAFEQSPSTQAGQLERVKEETELSYLLAETPGAIATSIEGLHRVKAIVRSMREFAHPDKKEPVSIDLNRAIQNTLTIASSEFRLVADLDVSYGTLPPVKCLPGEINQVVLNLVVNAAHSIADKHKGTYDRGHISLKTRLDGTDVVIEVRDDGCGIPPEVQPRIFDPFFTTKEVGRGTGQGLAIARAVIVNQHKGTMTFETQAGAGTTFFVRLPAL